MTKTTLSFREGAGSLFDMTHLVRRESYRSIIRNRRVEVSCGLQVACIRNILGRPTELFSFETPQLPQANNRSRVEAGLPRAISSIRMLK